MIDPVIDNSFFRGAMAIITGGAFVGWIRENRKAKKDVYSFAIEMLGQQAAELAAERLRVDALINDMAELRAERNLVADQLDRLRKENDDLRCEVKRLNEIIDTLKGTP